MHDNSIWMITIKNHHIYFSIGYFYKTIWNATNEEPTIVFRGGSENYITHFITPSNQNLQDQKIEHLPGLTFEVKTKNLESTLITKTCVFLYKFLNLLYF